MYGVFEAKSFIPLKILEQLYKQELIYIGEVDKKKEELNIYTTSMSVLHMTNIDPSTTTEAVQIPVRLLSKQNIKGKADDILFV